MLGPFEETEIQTRTHHTTPTMKLTNIQKSTRKAGMTLLELTVVILVLLSLISILFVGARAWKKGSDRAASILQIRNVQQAVRSNANMQGIAFEGTMAKADIFGAGKFMENDPTVANTDGTTKHPAGGTYAFAIAAPTVVPKLGDLYMKTGGTAPTGGEATTYYDPKADTTGDW